MEMFINMEEKKKIMIQVPDYIIRNNEIKMDANTFGVYVYLKFHHFLSVNKEEAMKIDHMKLKSKLGISDNRTIKKCLTNLHKLGIIFEYIDKLPSNGSISITLNQESHIEKQFTQLPATILNRIDNIGLIGLRLIYYYESYINRSSRLDQQLAYPSIELSAKDLKLNKNTILNYNEILRKNKLIKIEKAKLEYHEDSAFFDKYYNKYHVLVDKL
jgi:hypothetical protein